jgi:putative transposase
MQQCPLTARNATAPIRCFRKLLTGLRYVPRVLVTDRLASYGVAHRRLIPRVEHRRSKYLNNRVENSHQPIRARERARNASPHPATRSAFCPRLAAYQRTSGLLVTDSPQPNTDTK